MSVNVDKILGLGDDQLASQFVVTFPDGLPGGGDDGEISLRLDETFEAPEESVGQYEIRYRGMIIPKTNMSEGTSKEYTLVCRLDNQWRVYDALRKTFELSYNPIKGTALSDTLARFPVMVQTMDADNSISKTITMKSSKIKSLQLGSLGHEEEGAVKVTIGFIYGSMEFS